MISHSRTSTMVLGVTPVIFSKPGVVAHPDVTSDAQRINMTRRMNAPTHATITIGTCLPSMKHDRCIVRATDGEFRRTRTVNVPVAPLLYKEARAHSIELRRAAVGTEFPEM